MSRFFKGWNSIETCLFGNAARVIFLGVTLFCLFEVLRRHFFGVTFAWGTEVIVSLFLFAMWVYYGIALKEDVHLRVTLFVNLVPAKVRLCADILTNLIGLVYCFGMGLCLIDLSAEFYKLDARLEDSGLPVAVIYFVAATGMFLMSLGFIEKLHKDVPGKSVNKKKDSNEVMV